MKIIILIIIILFFFFFFWGGGGSGGRGDVRGRVLGVRVDVNNELKFL